MNVEFPGQIKTALIVFLGAGLLWIIFSNWRGDAPIRLNPQESQFEALGWLSENKNPYPFASNRFSGPSDIRLFIENLYRLEAVRVDVAGIYDEAWRLEKEGGAYADTLIVVLPEQERSRKAIFDVYKEECRNEGLRPESDQGQKELLFWWD